MLKSTITFLSICILLTSCSMQEPDTSEWIWKKVTLEEQDLSFELPEPVEESPGRRTFKASKGSYNFKVNWRSIGLSADERVKLESDRQMLEESVDAVTKESIERFKEELEKEGLGDYELNFDGTWEIEGGLGRQYFTEVTRIVLPSIFITSRFYYAHGDFFIFQVSGAAPSSPPVKRFLESIKFGA